MQLTPRREQSKRRCLRIGDKLRGICRASAIVALVQIAGLWFAGPTWAQQASGIAGVVRDTSGAVLPGVTVEAASPALIEKVRTALSDGDGRFTVVDLRPGTYTVTFTLPGFATVVREGIVLSTGFTATVNAEMRVGAVEETVTVSGAAPVVDTQTVRQQKLLSQEVIAALPIGNASYATLVAVTAGFTEGATDVGGTRDTWAAQGGYRFYHGKVGTRASFDGMRNQHFASGTGAGYIVNPDTVAEFQLETSGMSAEAGSGTTSLNAIPKEGSNAFSFMINGMISTSGMQSDNLTEALIARGFTTSQKVQKIYRSGVTVGGPIKKDKLWFFGAVGRWGVRNRVGGAFFNKLQGTMFHEPDLDRPADNFDWNRTHAARVTWQMTPRHKVAFFGDIQDNCRCTTGFTGSQAIEAQVGWDNWPSGILQATWSAPMTSRLLLEAGTSWQMYTWINFTQPGVTRDHISIREQSTNFRYGAPTTMQRPIANTGRSMQRFAMSYVTGSHTFKTGLTVEYAKNETSRERNGPDGVGYTFLRGVPIELDMYAVPFHHVERMSPEIGVYAQDQWTIKRLTVNFGLRFDYVNFYVPAENLPAGPFVPARRTERLDRIPQWSDWNPRVGASYDLFGNGRTAIKASVGRYSELTGSSFTSSVHPLSAAVLEASRSWRDANGNYIPDCDLKNFAPNGECGPIDNQNFGHFNPNATRFDDSILHDNRGFTWDFLTELQHELFPGLSVNVAYNHNWDRNALVTGAGSTGVRVTDNLAVTPADFSPYCITAPVDPRLPGGGGYELCGMYDLSPEKFGKVANLVTLDTNYGKQSRTWDGITLGVDGRFGRAFRIGGSLDVGQQVDDRCFVVDSPQELLNCRVVTPPRGLTDLRIHGSYALPAGFLVGAIYKNSPGVAIEANYPASNAEIAPSLGRSLAGGRRSATVPLIAPKTQFGERFTQLDLRLTKNFQVGRYRLQGNVDLYNALNSNSIQSIVTTFGPRWLRPLSILDARLVQLSGQLSF